MVSADADVVTALFSPAGRDDPQAVLRAADLPGCRYAVVNAVLHDRRFAPSTLPPSQDLMFQTLMRWMLRVDGDRHRRLRDRFGGLFTARRVENFRMMVSARADELLDVIDDRISFDLVDTFAKPLPFLVVCDVMGVPDGQRPWLRQQTATLGRAFANQRDRAFVERGNLAVRSLLDFSRPSSMSAPGVKAMTCSPCWAPGNSPTMRTEPTWSPTASSSSSPGTRPPAR